MSKTNPSHYTLENGMQVYDITKHFDFTVGNCIKYLMRCGNKGGESKLDDLKKCRWYLNQLIEREELNDARPTSKNVSIADNIHVCPDDVFTSNCWTD